MCLAQGPQRSDAGEARTRSPSVSSQALYHVFLFHKPITIKVNLAGQDLACTPETVEGSLIIETVLPLHWRSAMQYTATVSLPGRILNHGLTMVSTLIASRWSRPQSQILSSLYWLLMLVFSWAHRGST